MITKENVKCKYPTAEVNGLQLACNGNHPTQVHKKVMMRVYKEDQGDVLSKDMVKRIYMCELPITDPDGNALCLHKTNDPVNEPCLLRVN